MALTVCRVQGGRHPLDEAVKMESGGTSSGGLSRSMPLLANTTCVYSEPLFWTACRQPGQRGVLKLRGPSGMIDFISTLSQLCQLLL